VLDTDDRVFDTDFGHGSHGIGAQKATHRHNDCLQDKPPQNPHKDDGYVAVPHRTPPQAAE